MGKKVKKFSRKSTTEAGKNKKFKGTDVRTKKANALKTLRGEGYSNKDSKKIFGAIISGRVKRGKARGK
jgi:hypothetical protein